MTQILPYVSGQIVLIIYSSDPDSLNYGKHYTAEQVVDLFSPDADSIEIVKNWLAESGVKGVTTPKSKGWIDFKTTAKKLETLLETTYHVYEYTATGDKHLGTDSYKLPSQVSQHVDFITPGIVTDKIVPVTVSESGVQPGRPLKLTPISAAEVKKLSSSTQGTSHAIFAARFYLKFFNSCRLAVRHAHDTSLHQSSIQYHGRNAQKPK